MCSVSDGGRAGPRQTIEVYRMSEVRLNYESLAWENLDWIEIGDHDQNHYVPPTATYNFVQTIILSSRNSINFFTL